MTEQKPREMTIQDLINELSELADGGMDAEGDHIKADKLLLRFIGNRTVTKYFRKIQKWYA